MNFAISGGPFFFFDSVILLVSEKGAAVIIEEVAAINWVRDAFGHLKVIGYVAAAQPLLDAAAVVADDGIHLISARKSLITYLSTAKADRRWERELMPSWYWIEIARHTHCFNVNHNL